MLKDKSLQEYTSDLDCVSYEQLFTKLTTSQAALIKGGATCKVFFPPLIDGKFIDACTVFKGDGVPSCTNEGHQFAANLFCEKKGLSSALDWKTNWFGERENVLIANEEQGDFVDHKGAFHFQFILCGG